MPKFEFCKPTTGKAVPADPEWFHEIKWDGYRLRVVREDAQVRLFTMGGYEYTNAIRSRETGARRSSRGDFAIWLYRKL